MKFWQGVAFLETDQVLAVARAADRCGFDAVTVSDHIFFPQRLASAYPYTPDGSPYWAPETAWPDPWVLIGAMASVTERLRFTTNIYVAPARDLFTVAKAVSTAAVLSGGRVMLGAGPGWCREEFEQTGQDFTTRGRRLDEMVVVLRLLWGGGMVEHHGEFYDFDPLQISPVPARPVPVYLGGDSEAALRRAARVGDGWVGNAYTPDDADDVIDRMKRHLEDAGRAGDDFEIAIALVAPPKPDLYRRFEDSGVTALVCAPWMMARTADGSPPTAADRVAAVETFAERVIQRMR